MRHNGRMGRFRERRSTAEEALEEPCRLEGGCEPSKGDDLLKEHPIRLERLEMLDRLRASLCTTSSDVGLEVRSTPLAPLPMVAPPELELALAPHLEQRAPAHKLPPLAWGRRGGDRARAARFGVVVTPLLEVECLEHSHQAYKLAVAHAQAVAVDAHRHGAIAQSQPSQAQVEHHLQVKRCEDVGRPLGGVDQGLHQPSPIAQGCIRLERTRIFLVIPNVQSRLLDHAADARAARAAPASPSLARGTLPRLALRGEVGTGAEVDAQPLELERLTHARLGARALRATTRAHLVVQRVDEGEAAQHKAQSERHGVVLLLLLQAHVHVSEHELDSVGQRRDDIVDEALTLFPAARCLPLVLDSLPRRDARTQRCRRALRRHLGLIGLGLGEAAQHEVDTVDLHGNGLAHEITPRHVQLDAANEAARELARQAVREPFRVRPQGQIAKGGAVDAYSRKADPKEGLQLLLDHVGDGAAHPGERAIKDGRRRCCVQLV